MKHLGSKILLARRGWLTVGLGVLVAVAPGGCSSGYDVTLTVSETVNSTCATSCVKSVLMYAIGETEDDAQCVRNVSMSSLRQHGLGGRFDLAVPAGFAGVNVTGFRGPDCNELAIFDGVATVRGSEVKVPIDCLSSCDDHKVMPVKVTDVFAVMQGRCEVGTGNNVMSGVLMSDRWNTVLADYPNFTLLYSGSQVPLVAGEASIPSASFSVGRDYACPAVAVGRDNASISVACARRYRGLCLTAADIAANKVEIATLSTSVAQPPNEIRSIAVFAEKDQATGLPKPIAGATVAIELLSAPARIEYHDLTLQGGTPVLTTRAAASTGPSGAFSVYSREPVTIAVSHNGRTYRRQIGGGLTVLSQDVPVVGAQIITPE